MPFEEYRPYLFAIAYRMLGSVMEAEDILQEVYLRTREVSAQEIRNPKAYLGTIVTRLCLNQLSSARLQRETYVGPWLPEPLAITDSATLPESVALEHDTISLAFLRLLEQLGPVERAIFLLREVFDYEYDEIAGMVGKSESACRQACSRAKKRLQREKPRFRATVEEHHKLLQRFLDVVTGGDMEGLLSVLVDDVVMVSDGGGKATAARYPLQGAEKVARFVMGSQRNLPAGATVHVQTFNGRPGLIFRAPSGVAVTVLQIQLHSDRRIRQILAISNPDKIGHI